MPFVRAGRRLVLTTLAGCCLLTGAVTSCSSANQASPGVSPSTANASTTTTRSDGEQLPAAAARDAWKTARDKIAEDGTGRFSLTVLIGPSGSGLTVNQNGVFDLAQGRWTANLSFYEGSKPSAGSIVTVGTRTAVYLTSPQWPADIRGRWYRYTPDQFTKATGGLGRVDLSSGLPEVLLQVLTAKALSGHASAATVAIEAEVPATAALSMANLKSGLIKEKVDAKTLGGVAKVVLTIGNDQRLQRLEMAQGAMAGLTGVPSDIAQVARRATVLVEFDAFGDPMVIRVPTGKQIVPPSQMRP